MSYFAVLRGTFLKTGNLEQVINMTPPGHEFGCGEAYFAGKSGSEELIEYVFAHGDKEQLLDSVVSGASAKNQVHILKKYMTKNNKGIAITFAITKRAHESFRFLEKKGHITNRYVYEILLGKSHSHNDKETLVKIICDTRNSDNYFVAACAGGNMELIKLLGNSFGLIDKAFETVCKNGRLKVFKYLLKKKFEPQENHIEILFRYCQTNIILFLHSLGRSFKAEYFEQMKRGGYNYAAKVLKAIINTY